MVQKTYHCRDGERQDQCLEEQVSIGQFLISDGGNLLVPRCDQHGEGKIVFWLLTARVNIYMLIAGSNSDGVTNELLSGHLPLLKESWKLMAEVDVL